MAKNKFANAVKNLAEESYKKATSENIRISFKFVDWDSEEFFVHGMTKQYYQHLFDTFHDLEQATADDIKQQNHPRLTPKFINWKGDSTITRTSFPEKIKNSLRPQSGNDTDELQKQFEEMTRDSFELRVTLVSGRIHGFIFDNTFYVVWFDPAHNLFPCKDDKGRDKKIKLPEEVAKVKTFCPEEINRIKELNIRLYQENKELMKLLDIETQPNA